MLGHAHALRCLIVISSSFLGVIFRINCLFGVAKVIIIDEKTFFFTRFPMKICLFLLFSQKNKEKICRKEKNVVPLHPQSKESALLQ
jgi:hypothetical protein